MRGPRVALSLLVPALAACVAQQVEQPGNSWELIGDQPVVQVGADPVGRPPPDPASLSPQDAAAARDVRSLRDDDADLIDLFGVATDEDLGDAFLGEDLPSPFHRLGNNVIRGLDGSWTKIYKMRAGRADLAVKLLEQYVPGFPLEPGVANDPELPPTQLIRYFSQPNFYRDETKETFGSRSKNSDANIADVIHVTAPPNTLLFIDELLHKTFADLPQIEIEVLVVEVNLSDEIDWNSKLKVAQLENRGEPFDPVLNPPKGSFGAGPPIFDGGEADGSGGAFSSFPDGDISLPGFLLSMQGVHNDFTVSGIIGLLQNIGAAELLSSPKITVLDGHRAKLTTGDKLPIYETKGTVNNPTVSTSFEPTGVTIEMVPFILSDDLLRIDLSIDVSTQTGSSPLVLNGISVDSPIISQRSAGTTLHVYTDQTFALGGLKSTTQVETMTKVPLLGDIPILGWLFKSRTSQTRQTEILFFVKPTIKVPSQSLIDPLRSTEPSLLNPRQ